MRTAIFYDYLDQKGGGERIILELAKELKADIITTRFDKEKISQLGVEYNTIIELPMIARKSRFKHLSAMFAFSSCDFSKDYDFFIFSGFWSVFAAKKHKPNLYYCIDVFKDFYETKIKSPIQLLIKNSFERSFKNVDKIVAISEFNKKQVKDYYRRDSTVVYPPIRCGDYSFKKSGDFWLSINRLYPQKRIELQLEAFRLIPHKKLFVIGDFPKKDRIENYVSDLKSSKPDNVEFVSNASYRQLKDYYSNCEGFIATSKNEAFGMSVVEAMASGKGVVCVDEGGFRETVVDGVTGFLVPPRVSDLVKAIKKVSQKPGEFKEASIKRAKEFDSKIFFDKIKSEVGFVK